MNDDTTDDTTGTPCIVPDNTPSNALALAAMFSAVLAANTEDPVVWADRQARQLVQEALEPTFCTSHDWIDADMAMADAYARLGWTHPLEQMPEDPNTLPPGKEAAMWALHERGWGLAKRSGFNGPLLASAYLQAEPDGDGDIDRAMQAIEAGKPLPP